MNPQKDDTVYSIQGQEGTYISAFNGGHLVAPHYENPDGGMVLDAPEQWKEVFSKPPTAVLEKDVAKLSAQIAEMASRVTELRTQEREARQAFDATCKRLKGYEPLKNVVDFLDGKMTHVVVKDSCHRLDVRVCTIEQTISDGESEPNDYRNGKWTRPLKLMCLSQSVSAERLQPYLVVPQIGTFKHGSEAPFKEWQPIETAPKNGEIRIIIAEIRQDGEITNIDFDAVLEQESESWEIPALYWVWRSANGNVEEPTHWMPMPEIPSK